MISTVAETSEASIEEIDDALMNDYFRSYSCLKLSYALKLSQ